MYEQYNEIIEEILSKLTLKEKIGQLNQVPQPVPENLEETKERIRRGEIGSLILCNSPTAGNDEQQAVMVDLLNELQKIAVEESKSGIPMLFGRDVIHGHHTVYPIGLAAACSFNPELVRQSYRCIAKEASSESVHWTFSPMLDVCHEPRWGRIIEGPGEDPYLASRMAEAMVKGFQGDDLKADDSMIACAKHYLGYGASEGGRDYFRTEISDYTLYNMILPPFRAAVKAGAGTVMSSFNDINGQPVTSSKKYLTDILRGDLGFEGFVVSDWASVHQLLKQGVANDGRDCAKLAINAGLDMEMTDNHYIEDLENLVESGEVSIETIDEAVRRVLRIKLASGLFDKPYKEAFKVDRTNHIEIAEKMAAESMVLVKNDDNLLPLSKDLKIALYGPFTYERRALQGSWALDGYLGASTPNFLEAMNEVMEGQKGHIHFSYEGVLHDDSTYIYSMNDVIVLALGESHAATGEARCSADIVLSPNQVEMARKAKQSGKKVVGVIFCGRPLALENIEPYLDAILIAWHGGTRCAHAAAKSLFGEYNPCGKTAVTFVRKTGQIPLYYNITKSGRDVDGYYGQGYAQNYIDSLGSPMYPFGYGLSYTTYEYGEAEVDRNQISLEELLDGGKIQLSAKVKNTGSVSGKEIVQFYIRDHVASYMRPIRELKGFEKISLEAGEEKTVTFEVGTESLGFYMPDGKYVVEKGLVDLHIGENCLTNNLVTIEIV